MSKTESAMPIPAENVYVDPFVALSRSAIPDGGSMKARGEYACSLMGSLIARIPGESGGLSEEITKQLAVHAVRAADILFSELARTADPATRRTNK